MQQNLSASAQAHIRLRDQIKDAYRLADDDAALTDTLDGISDFKELVAAVVREIRVEEAHISAIALLLADMESRLSRKKAKIERLRNSIAYAMSEAGERKIDAPDATISLRQCQPKLVFRVEPDDAPNGKFVKEKITLSWDREAVKAALSNDDEDARAVAHFTNANPTLSIRTK